MLSKGVTLGQLKRSEEAIAVYDALIDKYQADPGAALREQVARAINKTGNPPALPGRQ